ncbi:MAG: decarboxylating 6-phosphogluconate dehydrogenase [Actinomycetota bacterium]|nr:decarboxylating 6-phosphogluconate dehydrogenase [Actinomycetota bacterium]
MKIGMVGLGRMGANMATRLMQGGHEVVGFDTNANTAAALEEKGAVAASSLASLVRELQPPRAVWVMVPSGRITEETFAQLSRLLEAGDIVVDGGNSRYTDSIRRAASLGALGMGFLDVGTSGGVWGLTEGYCLMVGGRKEDFHALLPIMTTLAPRDGYLHVGVAGAGHFTKMVHNGIEYALMQAYGEGMQLLAASDFDLDLAAIANVWRRGSVIRSWLLDLAAAALAKDSQLTQVADYVDDSGEGRWTIETALAHAVPLPAIAASVFARFSSREQESMSAKVVAALRKEFGGHAVGREGRAA